MKPGGVWRDVPLFVKSRKSERGEFEVLMYGVMGCPLSHRVRMRFADSTGGRVEMGVCLAVTFEFLWVTSCNPRLLATGDTVHYLWKDVAGAPILSFPQSRGTSWTSCDLPARGRGSANSPCAVLDSKTRRNKLEGKRSQHIHVSLNLMNVDAPPRELIFVYN